MKVYKKEATVASVAMSLMREWCGWSKANKCIRNTKDIYSHFLLSASSSYLSYTLWHMGLSRSIYILYCLWCIVEAGSISFDHSHHFLPPNYFTHTIGSFFCCESTAEIWSSGIISISCLISCRFIVSAPGYDHQDSCLLTKQYHRVLLGPPHFSA